MALRCETPLRGPLARWGWGVVAQSAAAIWVGAINPQSQRDHVIQSGWDDLPGFAVFGWAIVEVGPATRDRPGCHLTVPSPGGPNAHHRP
jgi:hypothetical protein